MVDDLALLSDRGFANGQECLVVNHTNIFFVTCSFTRIRAVRLESLLSA